MNAGNARDFDKKYMLYGIIKLAIVLFVAAALLSSGGCASKDAPAATAGPQWGDSVTKTLGSGETTTFEVRLYTEEEANQLDWRDNNYDHLDRQVQLRTKYLDENKLHQRLAEEYKLFGAGGTEWSAWDNALPAAQLLSEVGALAPGELEWLQGAAFVEDDDDLQGEVDALEVSKPEN